MEGSFSHKDLLRGAQKVGPLGWDGVADAKSAAKTAAPDRPASPPREGG